MLEDFLSYIVEELSIKRSDKILLAVSGGIDSMVMVRLFEQSEFYFEVAHINHSTRNGDSDKDEEFIKAYCMERDLTFHSVKLDYKILSKGNFQQNARKARYSFFNKTIEKNHLDYLATAHHRDDRWETFVMNLNRKSGIVGLTSLKQKNGKVIRPLMKFRKSELVSYAEMNDILYVEDSTNMEDDYTRNKVRHHISPILETVLPGFITNTNQSIENLSKSQALLSELIENSGIVKSEASNGYINVNLITLKTYQNKEALAYSILSPLGFNSSIISDILTTDSTGALFYSETHEALYNRDRLIIRRKKEKIKIDIDLEIPGEYTLEDGRVLIFSEDEGANRNHNHSLQINGKELIGKSIKIRTIEQGDRFYPSHMNGKSKSVKKHLTDLKIDRFTKENVLAVIIENKIVDLIF